MVSQSLHEDRHCLQILLFLSLALNSLTTKKQATKLTSANFQKNLSAISIIFIIQRLEGKQCRSR